MENREDKHKPKLTNRLHERREQQNPEEGSGVGSWIREVHAVDPQEKGVLRVSNSTKPGVEAPTQWSWVETTIWTERMLAALGNGVKAVNVLRATQTFHHERSPMGSEPIPMRKPMTGEPCAGEPHARFPETARTFLPNGEPPAGGDLIVQSDLAESFRTIAKEGPDVFYGGALGEVIVDDVQKNGGLLTIADLRAYRTVRRKPILSTYREYELSVPSPPCSGGVHLLQILHFLEDLDVASLGFGTADSMHLLAECFKIAFADRTAYMGDPAQIDVPIEWLISAEYAVQRQADISMERASYPDPGSPPSPESASTTHLTAADADGNIAALTQTINEGFGSRVIVPTTGLFLNNTMALFDPHPGHPNSVASGRRMVSSNSPTIISKDGRPLMALGTPGGVRIFPSVAQAIVNVIVHRMTLQEAVEAPRVWTQGQALEVESAVLEKVRYGLSARGHDLLEVKSVAGGMNGVIFDHDTGTITGAACWRDDGAPIAISGGPARPGVRFRPTVSRDDKG